MNVYGIGRIAKEIEYRNGVTKFTIAYNDYKKEAHFFNCVSFKGTGEVIYNNFSKGDRIFIDGMLVNNNYTKQDGTKVYRDQIIVNRFEFIEKKGFSSPTAEQVYQDTQPNHEQKQYEKLDIDNETLPF